MEFEKSKLAELKEKFDSIINERLAGFIRLYTVEKFFRGNEKGNDILRKC